MGIYAAPIFNIPNIAAILPKDVSAHNAIIDFCFAPFSVNAVAMLSAS